MNKQCIVSKDVGQKFCMSDILLETIDHFATMEGAIMFWDPFWELSGVMNAKKETSHVDQ